MVIIINCVVSKKTEAFLKKASAKVMIYQPSFGGHLYQYGG